MEIRPILSALLRSKTGAILIAVQVALTLAILCNALFVVHTRLQTASRPSGVAEGTVFQMLYIGAGEIEDRAAMMQRDLEALRAVPGVLAAASINSMPLGTSGTGMSLTADASHPSGTVVAAAFFSGQSLIDALGLNLVEGRDFEAAEIREVDSRDPELQADTVILTRHLARKLFPDEPTVVGKIVYRRPGASPIPMRVVGVVETLMTHMGQNSDTAYDSFILPITYLDDAAHYAVRTEPGQRDRVMAEAEQALTAARDNRVLRIMIHHRTMEEIHDRRYRAERSGASILIVVTLGLLLVTASGIVGVASLRVSQRRKQIGVRRALGARRRDIIRYFLIENLMITTAGVSIGVVLTVGLNQLLVSHIALDRLPVVYLIVGVPALWILGSLAALGPAWRAAAVPPAVATRSV